MYAPDLSYQILRLGLFVYSSKNDTEKVAPHILSIHTPPHPPGFRPLPFGLKLMDCLAYLALSWRKPTMDPRLPHFPWRPLRTCRFWAGDVSVKLLKRQLTVSHQSYHIYGGWTAVPAILVFTRVPGSWQYTTSLGINWTTLAIHGHTTLSSFHRFHELKSIMPQWIPHVM